MTITLVKKVLSDGSLCAKCQDIETRLNEGGYADRIDRVLIADERDPESPGMVLAESLGVERAPFFVVDRNGSQSVYTVYFKFVREVLDGQSEEREENQEILAANPELDLI